MSQKYELSWVVNHSSKRSQERILYLLNVLSEMTGKEENSDDWESLSKESIGIILSFAVTTFRPKFLFALGSDYSILRSANKGEAWKRVFFCVERKEPPKEAMEEDDELNEITALMRDAELRTVVSKEKEVHRSIEWLSCHGDVVAGGGVRQYLCVSGDRGLHFTVVPTTLFVSLLEPGARFDGGVLVGEDDLLVFSGHKVLSVVLIKSAMGEISFGEVRLRLTCQGRVSTIQNIKRGLRASAEVLVSEPGLLHISLNQGESFVSIPHNMGCIRSVDGLTEMRNALLPPFPSDSKVLQGEGDKKNTEEEDAPIKYEYAMGLRQSDRDHTNESFGEMVRDSFLPVQTAADYYYRYYLISGVGAEVLPYDYSAYLCVVIHCPHGGPLTTFTIASQVDYIPYTKSGPRESLLCASYKEYASRQVTLVRGNSSGVSFSSDNGKWSPPQKSSPVGIIPSDSGDCIVCCQRNTVHTFGPSLAVTTTTIPSNLRIPSLLTVVYSSS